MNHQNALEAAAAASAATLASKATYSGSLVAVAGSLLNSQMAVAVGMLVGLCGLLLQWHYKRKEHALRLAEHGWRRAEHEARMTRPHHDPDRGD